MNINRWKGKMGELPLTVYLTKLSKNFHGSTTVQVESYHLFACLSDLLSDPEKIDKKLIKKAKYKSKGKMYE